MSDILKHIFTYLEYEGIKIDTKEFTFQYESHPDYPSPIAISDTLKFFRIDNGFLKVKNNEIELLPDRFIAKLNNDNSHSFSLVSRKKGDYILNEGSKSSKTVSSSKLKSFWEEIVFLVENSNNVNTAKATNLFTIFSLVVFAVLSIFLSYSSFSNKWLLSFYLLPILGSLLSVGAFKISTNTSYNFLSKLCNITSNAASTAKTSTGSNCNAVIGTSKWKLFEKIDFTDFSLTFFLSQIVALFFMGILALQTQYFLIQSALLVLSTPFVITSLYYQKFIVKSWCGICLAITLVLLLETGFVLYLGSFSVLDISPNSLAIFLLIYVAVSLAWGQTKKLLLKKIDLEKQEVASNRLKRNYALFKSALMAEGKIDIPFNPIFSGNKNALLHFDILINPYCGYCKAPLSMLQKLVEDYGEQIKVSYFHNTNKMFSFHKLISNLLSIRISKGANAFNDALNYWFKYKNEPDWFVKYETEFDEVKINHILDSQRSWCQENKLALTPTLFINGYRFPLIYDILDIPFFINELLEDNELHSIVPEKSIISNMEII